MADVSKRLVQNVSGDFYVDSTCIDCDTCRQIAPASFRDHGGASSIYQQPSSQEETRLALSALVACPVGSIGTIEKHNIGPIIASFPSLVGENVYYCGFTAESSFGAWSYLIRRSAADGGNVLVDSPRFSSQLAKRIGELGGIDLMFLTHRDDVADHDKFFKEFGCHRIMHVADGARHLGVERLIEGTDAVRIDEQFLAIPTPGHTRGHMVLLYRDRFLFTGDHLSWSPVRNSLSASRPTCWYSWQEQTRSMSKLLAYSFEWVLPGHGRLHHDNSAVMHSQLRRCVEWMKAAG